MNRQEIIERVDRITSANCCWYETCSEIIKFKDLDGYNLDKSSSDGELFYLMLDLLNELTDKELFEFVKENNYIN